jgi:hypothetical protein
MRLTRQAVRHSATGIFLPLHFLKVIRMNTALTTTSGGDMLPAYQKITDPMAWCIEMGKAFQVTFSLTSPHHGTVMALTCLAENISPPIYNKRYHGDGSERASSMQAKFMERGGEIDWIDIGDDGKIANAVFNHPNLKRPLEIKYTIEDAAKQVGDKLNKAGSNWATNPGAMLRAALIRKAIKIIDPGIIGGFDSFNEFADQTIENVKAAASGKKSQAERKKELEADSATASTTTVIVESTETTNAVVSPAEADVIIDVVPESPPFATTKTRTELNQALALAGQSAGFSIQEMSDAVCASVSPPLAKITEATEESIIEFTEKFKLIAEAVKVAAMMPSKANPGSKMDRSEVFALTCERVGVDHIAKCPNDRLSNLVTALRNAVSK